MVRAHDHRCLQNPCRSLQIYVYAAKDGFAKLSTITSHQSFVTQVDFSVDGNYVQSADGAGSLLFADAATGIEIPSESYVLNPLQVVLVFPR